MMLLLFGVVLHLFLFLSSLVISDCFSVIIWMLGWLIFVSFFFLHYLMITTYYYFYLNEIIQEYLVKLQVYYLVT